jgi:hypothetical protein
LHSNDESLSQTGYDEVLCERYFVAAGSRRGDADDEITAGRKTVGDLCGEFLVAFLDGTPRKDVLLIHLARNEQVVETDIDPDLVAERVLGLVDVSETSFCSSDERVGAPSGGAGYDADLG